MTDANGDGDSADAGDEGDFIDCFEIVQTGTGQRHDRSTMAMCGGTAMTVVPGDGDDDVIGDGDDTIDWSSSSAGMAIDIPNRDRDRTGHRHVGRHRRTSSARTFDDTMIVDGDAPGPGVSEFFGGDGVDTVDGSAATAGVTINLDILDPSGADDLENVVGSAFNDKLDGNDLRNQINAGDWRRLPGRPAGQRHAARRGAATTPTSVAPAPTGSASPTPRRR